MTVSAALFDANAHVFRVLSMGAINLPPMGQLQHALDAQRTAAASRTVQGAAAKHTLAVTLSILAQEPSGPGCVEHWKEALKTWRELIDDDLFWNHMKDWSRRGGSPVYEPLTMRVTLCRQLSVSFSEAILEAVTAHEWNAVPAFVRVAMEHRPWLNCDAALISTGKQVIREGYEAFRAILDHLSQVALQDDETTIRRSLMLREKELCQVAAEYGAIVRSLGEMANAAGWDDAVAASRQKLAVAYSDLLNDPYQAVRLVAQARESAHEPQLLQSIKRDWQHFQRTVFCVDAQVLAEGHDFAGADRKLVAALALSTEEEKAEIRLMQNRNRQKREAKEQDLRQVQRVTLCREAGALMQAGEFARADYKLTAALAIADDEDREQVKGQLDQCRWARVLRDADSTRNKPFVFTLNGIGARLYGGRDYDLGTDSYVTVHWITIFFLPIFPLGAYRVTGAKGEPLRVHGRVGLPAMLGKGRWAFVACVLLLAVWIYLHQGYLPHPRLFSRVQAAIRFMAPARSP